LVVASHVIILHVQIEDVLVVGEALDLEHEVLHIPLDDLFLVVEILHLIPQQNLQDRHQLALLVGQSDRTGSHYTHEKTLDSDLPNEVHKVVGQPERKVLLIIAAFLLWIGGVVRSELVFFFELGKLILVLGEDGVSFEAVCEFRVSKDHSATRLAEGNLAEGEVLGLVEDVGKEGVG